MGLCLYPGFVSCHFLHTAILNIMQTNMGRPWTEHHTRWSRRCCWRLAEIERLEGELAGGKSRSHQTQPFARLSEINQSSPTSD
jgi:hypothetical protein